MFSAEYSKAFVTYAGKIMPAAVVFKAGSNYRWFRDRQQRQLYVADAGISGLILRMSAHVGNRCFGETIPGYKFFSLLL